MNDNTTMRRLGDYIRQVDERNSNGEISLSQGICNQKYFQDPKQVSATPHLDKIVRTGQFAYNRATTRNGDKISIALREGPDCTVSSAYCVFVITDENVIDPHWLWLWFKRPEFDRYAIFKSHGSAHEFFEFETMSNVVLPVPPIEEQREIVARHKAIEHKIDVNRRLIAKLEETARTIYRHTFVENIDPENLPDGWRMGTLGDFGKVITGKTPSSSCPDDFGSDYPFVTPGDFVGDKYLIQIERGISLNGYDKLKTKAVRPGDVMVTCIGSDMGKVAIATKLCISNQQINSIIVNNSIYTDYLYYTLTAMKQKLFDLGMGSSTLPLLNKSDFEKIEIIIPSESILREFSNSVNQMGKMILLLQTENLKISNLNKQS